ncbi:hypothetical protein TI05_09485 [Achromatium sp. WMS3]|nr:hypothetical protein TI05_09485 [Achromatium sp. WMS3]
MENLYVAATKSSPEINFDCKNNILEIKGESYPENTAKFYTPVISWLNEYVDALDAEQVTVNIELIYFNSSSSKVLLDIFDIFDELAGQGKQITLNWIFDVENENVEEAGEEFQEDFESLTFNLVPKEED